MILTLGNKCLRLQVKRRVLSDRDGNRDAGPDAFDFKESFTTSNLFKEIEIPKTGYIFQPNQLYIFSGDGILNTAEFFNQQLELIGVTYKELNAKQYILEFKFPIKLYQTSSIFFN